MELHYQSTSPQLNVAFIVECLLTAILIAVMADWMAAQAKHDLSSVDSTDALVHELETVREIVQEEQGKPQPAADEALDDEVLAEKDELDTGESKNA